MTFLGKNKRIHDEVQITPILIDESERREREKRRGEKRREAEAEAERKRRRERERSIERYTQRW